MTFKLPELSYSPDALEPHLSSTAVELHYGKHTKKYYDTASELAHGTVFEGKELKQLLTRGSVVKMDTVLYNNVSQAWNHTFYWNCMCPASQSDKPSSALSAAITNEFETFERFQTTFTNKATSAFGSAWVWLVWKNDRLSVKTTPNAGSPFMEPDATPLLALDVWEHAYLYQEDYFANRPKYIEAWWNIINWKFVSEQYEAVNKNK